MPQELPEDDINESNLEDILLPPGTGSEPEQDGLEPLAQSQGQASEPPVPSQPAVSSLPASLATRARAAGLPLDDLDNSDKLAEFVLDRYVQDRAYADYGRSALANPNNQGSQHVAQQGGNNNRPHDSVEQSVEEKFDLEGHYNSSWQTHKLDAAAEYAIKHGIVELSEDGIFRAKQGYEQLALPVLNQINQAHLSRQEQVKQLFEGNLYQNLDKVLWPAFEHRMKEAFESRLASQFTQYQNQQQESSFVEKWQDQNKSWLYDAQGQLTADGAKFRDVCNALGENWTGSSEKLAEYALKIAGINTSPAQAPQAQVEAQQDQGKPRGPDGKFLKAAEAKPTKQETFIVRARRHSSASESRNLAVNNNADYQIANDGELENMFMTAWKQAAVA